MPCVRGRGRARGAVHRAPLHQPFLRRPAPRARAPLRGRDGHRGTRLRHAHTGDRPRSGRRPERPVPAEQGPGEGARGVRRQVGAEPRRSDRRQLSARAGAVSVRPRHPSSRAGHSAAAGGRFREHRAPARRE